MITYPNIRAAVEIQYITQVRWFAECFFPTWMKDNFYDNNPNVTFEERVDPEDNSFELDICIESNYHSFTITYGSLDWGDDGRLHIPAENIGEYNSYYRGRLIDIAVFARAVYPRVFDKGFARLVQRSWDDFISDPNVDPMWRDGLLPKAIDTTTENE